MCTEEGYTIDLNIDPHTHEITYVLRGPTYGSPMGGYSQLLGYFTTIDEAKNFIKKFKETQKRVEEANKEL